MGDLAKLQERLRTQRPVEWDQLPDFPLYMDQVLSYMDRQILRFDEDDGLTAAMVNNYTKSGLVPRAEGKKYNREHLAYLTAICALKRVMPSRDMDLVIREELERQNVREGYGAFRESLGGALDAVAEEIAGRDEGGDPDTLSLASGAIHFALLSYAAGIASRRYVTMLRQKREDGGENAGKKAKKERENS